MPTLPQSARIGIDKDDHPKLTKSYLNKMPKRSIFFGFTLSLALLAPLPLQAQNEPGRAAIDARLDQLQAELVNKPPSESTLKAIQALIGKDAKYYRPRLLMGAALDKAGLPNDAIEQYKLAVAYGPESPKAVIQLVKALIGVNQSEPALRLLNAAHTRFPNDPEITYWVGNYFLNKGDMRMAEKSFLQAQSGNKNIQGLGVGLAKVRLSQKRYEQALQLAQEELNKHPNYANANAVKGMALFSMRRFPEALDPLRMSFQIFSLKPGFAKTYSQALYLTGRLPAALEPAVVAYAVATDQYSEDRDVTWLLNQLIINLPPAMVRAQVPAFSDRLDMLMKNPYMHLHLANMLEVRGFRDLATREYSKVLKLDPDNYEACVRLANNLELYYQQYDKALTYFAKAHALRPSDDQVSDRLIRLQNRLPSRPGDLAWQIKDLIRKQPCPVD